MGDQASKSDVSQYIARLNRGWTKPAELTFECWSAGGENQYRLMDEDGETYGPVCTGTREFLVLLRGFNAGRKV